MGSVVYTVGTAMHYDANLKELGADFNKAGKDAAGKIGIACKIPKNYKGGIVFKTPRLAQKYIEAKGFTRWAVYEVDADWDNDCEIDEQAGEQAFWKHLLVTSRILRKMDPLQ
jgi:hypothetical protein